MQVIGNDFRSILELAIPADLPVEVQIHTLETIVREDREETTKIQLELNLQIIELQLKVQPSTPPEVREQLVGAITTRLEGMGGLVWDCTSMLEEALEVITTLQEDPNIQHLETKAWELQKKYDSVRGIAQVVVLTQ